MEKSATFFSLLVLFGHRLDTLRYEPSIRSEEWCNLQPCLDLADLTLSQPSSSLFVFLLAITAIILGMRLQNPTWKRALVFWGVGAFSAGLSYQLLGFELKCDGRMDCLWTTPWEVIYMVFTMASILKMVEAVTGHKRWTLALFYFYSINLVISAYLPIRFLISFEFLLVVAIPCFIFMFYTNVVDYRRTRESRSRDFAFAWVLLGLIMVVYFAYFLTGIGHLLWEKGFWFSENDVLHILLLGWMFYLSKIVNNQYLIHQVAE